MKFKVDAFVEQLSLSDFGKIDLLLRTTYRGVRELYVPLEEPGVYFKLSHGLGQWVLKSWQVDGTDVVVGFWPGVPEERALAKAREIKAARAAQENEPRPPRPLHGLLQRYETHLKTLQSGVSMGRSLRRALNGLEERDVKDISAGELRMQLDPIAARAPKHANRCLAYLNAFFRWAVENEGVASNPAAAIPKFVVEKRVGRDLSLMELAAIWDAAEVLPLPERHAIRLLILLPFNRKSIERLRAVDLHRRGDQMCWQRPNPAIRGRPRGSVWWPLSPQAFEVVADAFDAASDKSHWLLDWSPGDPAVNWASCKIRLSKEVARRRELKQWVPMAPWRLDDFQRSFAKIATTTMSLSPELVARCQDKLDPFRSPTAIKWALSQACVDEAGEVLLQWGNLVGVATTRP